MRTIFTFVTIAMLAAWETTKSDAGAANAYALLDPATILHDGWRHMPLRSTTEYRIVSMDGRLAIRAEGTGSASGVIRRIEVDPARCPVLEWEWRVERMQAAADLRTKEGDDVAAALFLMFGDPGSLLDPEPVPTLRYVWTNRRVPVGAIIANPYMPEMVKNVVVESGGANLCEWVRETRNVADDFRRAFGQAPPDTIEAFALFTDNDQTKQPVTAYYGPARLTCRNQ